VFNALQYFMTLYFQSVQGLTAIQASVRFLPMVISGALTNVATGLLVHRVKANTLIIVSAILSTIPGLLMAVASPYWSYWSAPFISLLLCPIAADTLFTISNLVITSVFPTETQGLAGGVFNTISMIGNSVGLAITAVIAGEVSKHEAGGGHSRREELLDGYRASFWMCFAASVVVVGVTGWGLRSIGKVGLKRE
jgi:nitrate/nitrite transporter NarK